MKLRPIFKIYLLLGFPSKRLETPQTCSLAPYLSPLEAFFGLFETYWKIQALEKN